MITTANVVSYGISIIAVLITIYTLVKNSTKEDSSAMTTVIVKLENIENGVKETQRDMKDLRDDVRGIDKRVTRLETLMEDSGK